MRGMPRRHPLLTTDVYAPVCETGLGLCWQALTRGRGAALGKNCQVIVLSCQLEPDGRREMLVKAADTHVTKRISSTPTAMGLAARMALSRLEEEGIDPLPLLRRSRLKLDDLVNEKRINAVAQIRFLNEASRAARDEWIGINMAQSVDLRRLGMLYYVAASSNSLRDGFRRLNRYARLGNEAVVGRIADGDDFEV